MEQASAACCRIDPRFNRHPLRNIGNSVERCHAADEEKSTATILVWSLETWPYHFHFDGHILSSVRSPAVSVASMKTQNDSPPKRIRYRRSFATRQEVVEAAGYIKCKADVKALCEDPGKFLCGKTNPERLRHRFRQWPSVHWTGQAVKSFRLLVAGFKCRGLN